MYLDGHGSGLMQGGVLLRAWWLASQVITPQLTTSDAVSVEFGEGDLLVLDPMLLHSASANGGAIPSRYVLFTTLFHESAAGATLAGIKDRVAVAPPAKFPKSLRESLEPTLHSLLEWRLPMAADAHDLTVKQALKGLAATPAKL
eukprot:COSAG01_NODE_6427_length_3673_cov_69.208170_2_plen_145_part_00